MKKDSVSTQVMSLSLVTIGALIAIAFSGDSRRAWGGTMRCTASTSASCATCSGTSNAYQCMPAALPTGQIYGTCPAGVGGCGRNLQITSCGNADFTCGPNPVSIDGGTACSTETPSVCTTP